MRTREGTLEGRGRRFAVVASRFNGIVTEKLVEGAIAAFRKLGIADDDIELAWTPGAFEAPLAAMRLATSGQFDAVVCLGAVIRGETPHFDYVAAEAASGLQLAALETGVPVSFGVLTCDTRGQAEARAGGERGNKGAEAARSALEMADVFARLRVSAAQ